KPKVGAFLILDDQGRARLHETLYAGGDSESEASAGETGGEQDTAPGASKAPGLSQRLVDELSIQRRDILAVHVAADPALALDLAIFLMIDREACYSSERSGSCVI